MSFVNSLRMKAKSIQLVVVNRRGTMHDVGSSWQNVVSLLRGHMSANGEEWITSREVYDALAIPLPARPSLSRRVAGLMRNAGWQSAVVGPRHFRQRGYLKPIELALNTTLSEQPLAVKQSAFCS